MSFPHAPKAGYVLAAADSDALAHVAAHLVRAWIAEAHQRDGVVRVALSGGSTPIALFRVLATLAVPWADVEWFWVDERVVPIDDPRSNFGAAREAFFRHVPVPAERLHPMVPDSSDRDMEATARSYERLLAAKFDLAEDACSDASFPDPVFDLILLGIGNDGHTASLFPHEPTVDVADRWVTVVPAVSGREARLSLTRPVLTAARRLVVLAQGEAKREKIRQARAPGLLAETPARLTQAAQGELIWLVDAAARP